MCKNIEMYETIKAYNNEDITQLNTPNRDLYMDSRFIPNSHFPENPEIPENRGNTPKRPKTAKTPKSDKKR